MFNTSELQGTEIPLPAQDVEMSLERDPPPGNVCDSHPPPQNTQAPDVLAFIEQQKKTIENCMAQVSH
jgi:hypothetical protein